MMRVIPVAPGFATITTSFEMALGSHPIKSRPRFPSGDVLLYFIPLHFGIPPTLSTRELSRMSIHTDELRTRRLEALITPASWRTPSR